MIGNPIDNSVSLYFHIPFCSKKCGYCHFYVLPDRDDLKKQLVEGLKLEFEKILPLLAKREIVSLYFGGGTPYLLGPDYLRQILSWLPHNLSNAEITLEANPENMKAESLQQYYDAGVNRLSIGVQSLDDKQLTILTRQHDAQKAIQAVKMASSIGFDNISIDLMYDLPGQTLESWEQTLNAAVELPITHLSLYNLTIEPHTGFHKKRKELQSLLPLEESSKRMYEMACEILPKGNLRQYEISAFSKENFHSRHNIGYWTGRQFLGLGPSAFSYWERRRFRNVANLAKYKKILDAGAFPIDFEEELSVEAQQRELLIIALRLLIGVNLTTFQTHYSPLSEECHSILNLLIAEGYLKRIQDHLLLTQKGILFYDTVAAEIVYTDMVQIT